jgi:NADPH-dependent 2,4-dienoyl-CoA reductase/sulfur reductase-like enzyme
MEIILGSYNVDIHTLHEVLSISPDAKSVTVKNLTTGDVLTDHYDKLVIATGARKHNLQNEYTTITAN